MSLNIVLLTPRRQFIANKYGLGYQIPLGLVFIGGPLIDAGHQVKLIDNDVLGWDNKQLALELAKNPPDCLMIGHTGSTAAHPAAMETAKIVRQQLPNTVIVYGGVFPTYAAKTILSENLAIDIIVQGEGEETAVELISALEQNHSALAWVIGTTWTGAMVASQELAQRFQDMTRDNPNQITSSDKQDIIDTLIKRVDSGGMLVVNSDLYPVEPMGTEFADIVLPAAGWGEHNAARCNGERRLRLYSKFYDAPGETKPDWWAVSQFAQKMGFEGFEWEEDNDIFEEAARHSRGGLLDYNALVWKAKQDGKKGHELLRELGTTGIQTPIRVENGELVGTKRVHDSTLVLGPPEGPTMNSKWLTHFRSHSGKALFIKTPWENFSDFYDRITPDREKGEFWITNGRINEIWQSGFDDVRKPYLENRWPDTFAEINPQDAAEYGIESGDDIRMFSDDILIQTSGFNRVKPEEINFTWMLENGIIKAGKGEAKAVAIVTDAVPPGVIFTNFLHPSSPANSLVHRVPDPITNRYRFKLGKGQIERLGESPFKNDFRYMSFKPRDVA